MVEVEELLVEQVVLLVPAKVLVSRPLEMQVLHALQELLVLLVQLLAVEQLSVKRFEM